MLSTFDSMMIFAKLGPNPNPSDRPAQPERASKQEGGKGEGGRQTEGQFSSTLFLVF